MPRSRLLLLGSLSILLGFVALGFWSPSAPARVSSRLAAASLAPARAPQASAGAAPPSASGSPGVRPTSPGTCPPEMALVAGSCVDRYEARLLAPRADGVFEPYPAHERPSGTQLVAESRAGVKPQAFISQLEAANACANAGKRLCSLVEWYRACSGLARTTYPYGVAFEAARCNVGKPHLLSLLHGSESRAWTYAHFNDPELGKREGFLALTGEYAGCATPEGVQDLVGNLHEWVADRVDSSLARKLPVAAVIQRRIGKTAGNGIFMGGFFSTTNEHGPGCTFVTAAHHTGYHDYSTGFRCCREP